MRREVLDDADVADAVGERPDAFGGDEEDLAELALLVHAAAELLERRVEALDVPHRGLDARLPHGGDELPRLLGRRGERLLDQHVHPGGDELAHGRQVFLGGDGDDGEVDRPGGEQRRDVGEEHRAVVHDPEAVARGVDGAGERDARKGLQDPGVVAPDHPQAEDRAAQRRGVVGGGHGVVRVSGVSDPTAPGLVLSPSATVGAGVTFGAHVVVHDGVVLGDGVVVQDHVVLGKAPKLAPRSSAGTGGVLEALVVEEGAAICAGAIVFAGAHIGPGVIVGDQAYVRERSRIGAGSLVGRGSAIDNDVVVGERVRVQTGVYLTAFSTVEDDVFIGPGVTTTNDDAMGRVAPGAPLHGATLRRACRVGGGAVLLPGIEVGEEAFVAAGSVVTNDVPPRGLVMGVPARVVRQVADADLLEHWS